MSEKQIFLSLGTNLGDRVANLQNAIDALQSQRVQVVRSSSIYETEPQDLKEQPWFLNMAVECRTRFFPLQLLAVIARIERQMGRERKRDSLAKGPRSIDIDILLYGTAVIDSPNLLIPHPRMLDRRFVLEPLCEIDEKLKHPVTGISFKLRLKQLNNQLVRRYIARAPS
jgi:2-amino-4-hydroxy-6-hydroxymethyldihydropteridine diphosphokinase